MKPSEWINDSELSAVRHRHRDLEQDQLDVDNGPTPEGDQ